MVRQVVGFYTKSMLCFFCSLALFLSLVHALVGSLSLNSQGSERDEMRKKLRIQRKENLDLYAEEPINKQKARK